MKRRENENNLLPRLRFVNVSLRDLPPQNSDKFKRYEKYRKMYVDEKYRGNLPPIQLFNTVKPIFGHKFVMHVLLSMGRFDTELDLYRGHNLKTWFCNAGLVQSATDILEEEVY